MTATPRPGPKARSAGAPARARDAGAASRSSLGPAAGVPRAWSAALAALACATYLALAPHTSGDKDASEFVLVLASGGVVHPTGYPIYTLLGHAFVTLLHALGTGYPFAANAWAACGGGVATYLLHRLAVRLLPARRGLSRRSSFLLTAIPVMAFGVNPVWMVECTVVEVHSWQLSWGFGAALVAAGFIEDLGRGDGAERPNLPLRMLAWGLLCGVGGAHHVTAVFVAGGLTAALTWALAAAKRFRAWIPLAWLAGGLLPLGAYGWIAYRAAHPGAAEIWPSLEPGLAGMLAHATAREYRGYLGHFAPDDSQAVWLGAYVAPYLWAGLALLAWQCWSSRGARRTLLAGLLLAALAQVAFVFRYGVSDPDAYFLPPLAAALLAVVGPLGAWFSGRARATAAMAGAGLALALLAIAVPNVTLMAGRRGAIEDADRYFRQLWDALPDRHGIVLWPQDVYYRFKEYQMFRGEKRALDVVNTASLFHDEPRARFRARWGFDPLATQDAAHLSEPVRPEYVIGRNTPGPLMAMYALVHEQIAAHAGVPVFAIDPPDPPRELPVPGAASDTARATSAPAR